MGAEACEARRKVTWGTGRNAYAAERRRYEGTGVALLYVERIAGFVFADLVAEVVVDGF